MKSLTWLLLTGAFVGIMVTPAWAGFSQPDGRDLTFGEIGLSVVAIVFAAVAIVVAAWMRVRQVIGADATFKLVGLALVIGAALFLTAAGYSQTQMTPVVGILGTALGFIFGKSVGESK